MSSLVSVRAICRRWAVQVRSNLIVGLVALVLLHVVTFVAALFGSGAVASADVTFGPVSVVAGSPPNSGFVAVSCVSTGNCTAVGIGDNTNTVVCDSDTGICTNILASKPLYAIETNGTWGTPVKIDAPGGPGATFTAVSCTSPLDCTAVGVTGDVQSSFAVTETSGTWGTPVQFSSQYRVILTGVSCTSPGNCTAVGGWQTAAAMLYMDQTDGIWGAPTAIPWNPTDLIIGNLYAVSCTSPGNCTAVGQDLVTGLPIYVVETGGVWGTPSRVAAPPTGRGIFFGVSCPSPLDCTAVGLGIPNGQPLAANQTNGVWDAVATQIAGDVLNSVSCTAPGNCTAVGMDEMIQALSVSQVNGVWGMPQSDTTAQGGGSHFFGVSCVPGGPCTAVGVDGNNAPIYAVSTVTAGTPCAAGSYSTTGFEPCTPAPAGSYAAGTGDTSASLCPAGTYQPNSGQTSCLPASPGNFVAGTGQTTQTPCPAGRYQPNSGQTSCIAASPGNFVAGTGQAAQTPCPVGRYQPNSGQISCIATSPGHFVALIEQVAQTSCAPGSYQPDSGASSCILASPGYFVAAAGATAQVQCPTGTTSPAGATACNLILFNFTGFFAPVDNPPLVNTMKAGSAVPVKFSLGGNRGLAIFAAGYPKSQPIACDSGSPTDSIEETATAGGSTLTYDATTDQYKYVWKTDKAWRGCRQLILQFTDGTTQSALFRF